MPVVPGDYLSLTCNVETPKNQGKPSIHWEAPDKKQKSANEGTLNIKVTAQEAGEWTCVMGEEFKATVSVQVVGEYVLMSFNRGVPLSLTTIFY